MYRSRLIYSALAFVLLAAGFVFSFWPVSAIGLFFAAISGQYSTAVAIGLLMDISYGSPVGSLHFFYVPFTLLAFLSCALQYYFSAYVRGEDSGRL